MRYQARLSIIFAMACVFAICLGCGNSDEQTTQTESPLEQKTEDKKSEPEVYVRPDEVLEKGTPKVKATDSHMATCRVKVGDLMPVESPLRDLEGNQLSLPLFFGEKATVLFFWNEANPNSVDGLQEVGWDFFNWLEKLIKDGKVVESDAGKAVRVISINVGDTAEVAQGVFEDPEVHIHEKVEKLLDVQGKFFFEHVVVKGDVAKKGRIDAERMPRTYVLDKDGIIVWFDFDPRYSPKTRENIQRTVTTELEKK